MKSPMYPELSGLDPDERVIYLERIGHMVADGPVTIEARSEAMKDVELYRKAMRDNNETPCLL